MNFQTSLPTSQAPALAQKLNVSLRKKRKLLRHKAEMPLVRFGILFTVAVVALAILLLFGNEKVPSFIQGIIVVLVAGPVVNFFNIRYQYWKAIVDAVEVTKQQLPDIYEVFEEAAAAIGMEKTPKLFILNGNGLLNAYSSKCTLHKNYVVIYSDIVDIYYEQQNRDMLRFVLSHEMGHIYLGHVNIRRQVLSSVLRFILLANTLTRAQEYSADRVAASVTAPGTRAAALLPLFAGKHVYTKTSIDHYISNDVPGQSSFWVAVTNFMATHPVGKRRLLAAYRMDHEDWQRVHGKML